VDVGCERAEPYRVGNRFVVHGQGEVGAAVEAVIEGSDRPAPGVGASDLDGVLDRLSAGVDEHRLLRVVAGCLGGEPLRQVHVPLEGADAEQSVGELAQLR